MVKTLKYDNPDHKIKLKIRQFQVMGKSTGQINNIRVSPSGGGTGGSPMSSMSPLIKAVSPHKIEKLSPPIFVDHDKDFFRYFFNFCMTKANLTSITSLKDATLLSYWNIKATTIEITKVGSMRLQLHDAIHCHHSFVLMLHYCANLKAIRYKSTSFNRLVVEKLHGVIPA